MIKYTYYGDANLDGKVDGSDFTLIDNEFNTQGPSLAASIAFAPVAMVESATASVKRDVAGRFEMPSNSESISNRLFSQSGLIPFEGLVGDTDDLVLKRDILDKLDA